MADKSITDLNEATELIDSGLLVVYQAGETKKMQGQALKQYIQAVADVNAAKDAANRAESAAAEAAQVVTHTPYIGENGNWFVWDNSKKKYVDSTVDASITVQVADVTMLPFGSAPYITNTGTDTDPVFHLFIPSAKNGNDGHTPVKGVDYFDGRDGRDGVDGHTPVKGVDYVDGKDGRDGVDGYTPIKGVDYFDGKDGKDGAPGRDGVDGFSPTVSVSQISGGHKVTVTDKDGSNDFNVMDGDTITDIRQTSGTGAAGTVDTYTIITSSGATYTFEVRNGADGKGSGDMLKTVYDPNNKTTDIFAYAESKASAAESNAKAYTYSRNEIDTKVSGAGKVKTVNRKDPDASGNITLSASDVGARPDNWAPTAEEVGARPNTWTPSKSDVGLGNVDNVKQYSSSNPPSASTITAGTFAGAVVAGASNQDPGSSLLRNSKLVSVDTTPTNNGEIFWTYG